MPNELMTYLRMFSMSRRHFIQASAVAGTLAAVTTFTPSSIAGIALAESAAQTDGDLGILNYALTLEHLEAQLYKVLIGSGLLSGKALAYANAYGAHETTHVDALIDTITKLGGTPVKAQAAYNFPKLTTQDEVIATLVKVEDLGASAYLGAAPLLQNADLLTVAVQIHTVEAEHATAWRFLAGQDPVPFAFAPPMSKEDVIKAVTPFLTVPAGTTPAPGTPAQMPNTGAGDSDTLQFIGIAGGIATAAVGAALLRKHQLDAAKDAG